MAPLRTREGDGPVLTAPTKPNESPVALRDRVDRLERALRTNPAGVYSLKLNPEAPDGPPLDSLISNGLLDLLGCCRDSLGDDPLATWRGYLHPEDRDRVLAAQKDLKRKGTLTLDYRLVRADGGIIWINDRVALVRDSQGRRCEIVGAWLPLTERHTMEEELRRSNEELEQFAYAVSHDLQEPLRMVSAYMGLLRRRYEGRLDDEADEFIRFAMDGAQRMHRMIHDLLEYSRLHTRGAPFERVDLGVCLAQALANLRAAITESGGTVDVGDDDGLPEAWGDGAQFARLFQNLIGNALKYHRPDVPPHVTVTAASTPDGVRVSVSDNGIGIAPEHFGRIFLLFQRLHANTENTEGTGIGLAVCKRIAQRHGGRIDVESQPGQGSTFHVTLPRPPIPRPAASRTQRHS